LAALDALDAGDVAPDALTAVLPASVPASLGAVPVPVFEPEATGLALRVPEEVSFTVFVAAILFVSIVLRGP
jgi:hypothetical protein